MDQHHTGKVTRDGKVFYFVEVEPDQYIEVKSLDHITHEDIEAYVTQEKESGQGTLKMTRRYFSMYPGEWESLEPIQ